MSRPIRRWYTLKVLCIFIYLVSTYWLVKPTNQTVVYRESIVYYYLFIVSPHWLVEPTNQTVVYHESVVINCQAGGNPRPTISWRRSTGKKNHNLNYSIFSRKNMESSFILDQTKFSGYHCKSDMSLYSNFKSHLQFL